jgi:hypothetical protein
MRLIKEKSDFHQFLYIILLIKWLFVFPSQKLALLKRNVAYFLTPMANYHQ